MSLSRLSSVFVGALALAGSAYAQGSLSEILPRLLSESVTMPSTVSLPPGSGNPHEGHFLPAAAQLAAPYALNSALTTQLSTFPLGSSSGGFTYSTDAKTGIPQRNSTNFGPAFAERALTNGKGHFSAGFNFQHVDFDRFEGQGLDGGVRFYLQHNDCCPGQTADGTPGPPDPKEKNPFFEGDLVRTDLTLHAKTDTSVFFATYGITDRIDIGVAVPIVRVDLTASIDSTILRLATSDNRLIHSFGGVTPDRRVSTESGTSSGLGDIVIREKLNILSSPGGGLALGVDLRLPSGDEKQLRGTGATQTRVALYYSADYGKFSPHYNAGYTFSSGSIDSSFASYQLGDEVPDPSKSGAPDAYNTAFRSETPTSPLTAADLKVPDEINYTAGLVLALHPRLTLAADFIGRTLRDVNRFGVVSKSFNYRTTTGGALQSQSYPDALDITSRGNLNLFLGVAGLKINVAKTLLLNVNVLFPLSDDGLRPKTTAVFGLDYAF